MARALNRAAVRSRTARRRQLLLALALAGAGLSAAAQDYQRELRWQAEVLSNLEVGEAVRIGLPSSRRQFLALYTQAAARKPAVLLVHGSGVHPDHGVIGILRVTLVDMGFSTLSIQMPVLAANARAEEYEPLFPEAAGRIAAAAEWLGSRSDRRIVLLSHSLGSWMSQHYFQSVGTAPFAAWISLGPVGELGEAAGPGVPVLDVYGEHDLPAVLRDAAERRRRLQRIAGARQIVIRGADHFYTGKEHELAGAVRDFIDALR
jgi:pimeloyl-ACP methyl ester carboxylesterase